MKEREKSKGNNNVRNTARVAFLYYTTQARYTPPPRMLPFLFNPVRFYLFRDLIVTRVDGNYEKDKLLLIDLMARRDNKNKILHVSKSAHL